MHWLMALSLSLSANADSIGKGRVCLRVCRCIMAVSTCSLAMRRQTECWFFRKFGFIGEVLHLEMHRCIYCFSGFDCVFEGMLKVEEGQERLEIGQKLDLENEAQPF